MSEAKIIFAFNGSKTTILCKTNDKMRHIFEKFSQKIDGNIGINKLYFLYNGTKINEELKFEEIINNEDKMNKRMDIVVYDIDKYIFENDKIIKSEEIICQECKEKVMLKIKDFKITLYKCKNGHEIKDIKLNEFDNTQMVNISKIQCDICKNNNKGSAYNNIFYRCISCNNNICPLCQSNHNKTHKIINYNDINYICDKHNEAYIKYCDNCNTNICMQCENEHEGHNIIYFGKILPNQNNYLNELKEYINKFKQDIKDIISKLENVVMNMEIYYNMSYNNIMNYINNNKRNYELLNIINEFISYNNIVIKDIKEILNESEINNKMQQLMKIYNNMNNINNMNYIIGEINVQEKDINKEIRIINSYEEFKREYKELNKKDYKNKEIDEDKYNNEKEIKEKCTIEINSQIIPFSYKYKFNKKGKYEIKYLFKEKLNKSDYMFFKCQSITYLDLSNFDTQNVINMSNIFDGCSSLKNLNLSNLNTQNVKYMLSLFDGCSSLLSLNLADFNTENVLNMKCMFQKCSSLLDLNLFSFNTQNVTVMTDMFADCSSLTSLNLSNFDTQNVINMSGMFADCNSLKDLNLSNFITQKVTDMGYMFGECNSLSDLNLSNFNTQKVKDMSFMFDGCSSLLNLNLSNFNTENAGEMRDMFKGCISLNKENIITQDKKIKEQFRKDTSSY